MDSYQDGNYWYSKLSDSRQCLHKYERKHILKEKEPGELSSDLEFGTAMHLSINDILLGGDGLAIFSLYWESLQGKELAYGRLDWKQLRSCGEVLLSRFKRLHAKHFKPYQMEERLFATLGPHKFEGTPDFLGSYKDVPSVVDFKTAGYRYDKKKLLCDEQMPLYALLAEKHGYQAKQIVYVVLIKHPDAPSIQVIKRDLTSTVLSSTLQNVVATCDDLEGRKSFPRNTSSCIRGTIVCPFFEKCWGKVDGGNEDE